MATQGFIGFYIETRNYGATAAFWKSLGFETLFEDGHGSGQWRHSSGGPYIFIAEHPDENHTLETHPILGVDDADAFAPDRAVDFAREFEPQHWGMTEAIILDPDSRPVSLQAPLLTE